MASSVVAMGLAVRVVLWLGVHRALRLRGIEDARPLALHRAAVAPRAAVVAERLAAATSHMITGHLLFDDGLASRALLEVVAAELHRGGVHRRHAGTGVLLLLTGFA